MKIPAIKPFVKKHGFDGLISAVAPLILAPTALAGILSHSPIYPVAMMGLWSNSLFQGVKQASPSRIAAYSLALVAGFRWAINKIQFNDKTQNKSNCNLSSEAQKNLPSETLRKNENALFGKLIYPFAMLITYLASGSYMAKTAKPIEGSLFKPKWEFSYREHLHHNLKAEFGWLRNPFQSLPLSLNFAQMLLRAGSCGLFGLAFAQSGMDFDDNPISRIADKLLFAGDYLGGATDIATGLSKDLIKQYGLFASSIELAGGVCDIGAGAMRNNSVGITSRFAATALAQLAGGLKGLGK